MQGTRSATGIWNRWYFADLSGLFVVGFQQVLSTSRRILYQKYCRIFQLMYTTLRESEKRTLYALAFLFSYS